MLTSHGRWSLPMVVPATRTWELSAAQLDAHEVRVVAGRARALFLHLDAALGRDQRSVDVVHGAVGPALEGAVEGRDGEQARVVVRERAVDRDHDLLGGAVGELHRDAPQPRRERHVRPEHLEVVGADHRDVDGVRDQAAVERRGDLLRDDHARPVLRLAGRRREMRRDDDVVELEQRAGVGLVDEDVERGAGDLARTERREQSVLVEQRAARGVHDPHAGTHRLERGGVDRAARLGGQRQVQGEEVRGGIHVLRETRPTRRPARGSALRSRTGRTPRPASRARARAGRPAARSGRSRAPRASCRRARCRRTRSVPSGPA